MGSIDSRCGEKYSNCLIAIFTFSGALLLVAIVIGAQLQKLLLNNNSVFLNHRMYYKV